MTKHRDRNGKPLYTNALIKESSPYLRQHAHNPVDWHPWGDEAFRLAAREDKPVFLSIGYSTCHWCHVMETESFDDLVVADFLNEHFVSIKLDREQRPDLDDIYMTGVQLMTGQGGWPMSSFLTHDGSPFHAGTYYPRDQFLQLLSQLSAAWRNHRHEVMDQARKMRHAIARYTTAASRTQDLNPGLVDDGAREIVSGLDQRHGGFGDAPKFPNEPRLMLLVEDAIRNGNPSSRDALMLTLDRMYCGGIFDQVGGGFHRYTVDRAWLVPHFEKMLYNQAQLLSVYTGAFRLTRNEAYHQVAMEVADYVLRDLRSRDGLFYSAVDADSGGVEGLFYLWEMEELKELLEPDQLDLVCRFYAVRPEGNFEGKSILHMPTTPAEYARENGLSLTDLLTDLRKIRNLLREARESRIHPMRDEKVITAWNGLMIQALVLAGHDLDEPRYVHTARDSFEALWSLHTAGDAENGLNLWRISLDGEVSIPANLEDHACLAVAALQLHGCTGDHRYLDRARLLLEDMNDLFSDRRAGGFFLSREDADGPLVTRPKSPMDGATPAANGVALQALVMAHEATGDVAYRLLADQTIACFSGLVNSSPSAFSSLLTAFACLRDGRRGTVQFAADGKIRVVVQRVAQTITLKLHIAENWHINTHEPNSGTRRDDDPGVASGPDGPDTRLVPTEIMRTGDVKDIEYPANAEFWCGTVTIRVRVRSPGMARLQLCMQACRDHLCLAPERLVFCC